MNRMPVAVLLLWAAILVAVSTILLALAEADTECCFVLLASSLWLAFLLAVVCFVSGLVLLGVGGAWKSYRGHPLRAFGVAALGLVATSTLFVAWAVVDYLWGSPSAVW